MFRFGGTAAAFLSVTVLAAPAFGAIPPSTAAEAAAMKAVLADAVAHGQDDVGRAACMVLQSWARCSYGYDMHKGDGVSFRVLQMKNGAWSVIHYGDFMHPLTAQILHDKYGVPMSVAEKLVPANQPQ
jgi:hypothetical protein